MGIGGGFPAMVPLSDVYLHTKASRDRRKSVADLCLRVVPLDWGGGSVACGWVG